MTISAAASDRTFYRFAEFIALTADDRAQILRLADKPTARHPGAIIREQSIEPACVYLLIEGWALSSIDLEDGTRQISKVHLPGDLMGMPSVSLKETADALTALTPVIVGRIPLDRFARLFITSPRFAMAMFLSAQRERIALMDVLTRIGRTSSLQRIAWLLLDLHERLTEAGLCGPSGFDLKLNQQQIADILGITTVHANRMFGRLQRGGLIQRDRQRIEILDRLALMRMVNWQRRAVASDPGWLSWDVATPLSGEPIGFMDAMHLRSNVRPGTQGGPSEICDGPRAGSPTSVASIRPGC